MQLVRFDWSWRPSSAGTGGQFSLLSAYLRRRKHPSIVEARRARRAPLFANNPDVQLTVQDESDMVAYLRLLR
jgi:hypothetical protein